MSGPKLSAYELELRKREALKKVQDRIIYIKTKAIDDCHRIDEIINHLHQQMNLLEATSISDIEKRKAIETIKEQICDLEQFRQTYLSIHISQIGGGLEELQSALQSLEKRMNALESQEVAVANKSLLYKDTLVQAVNSSSEEDADTGIEVTLSSISSSFPKDERKILNDSITYLINRANEYLNYDMLDNESKDRLQKAVRQIQNPSITARALSEIESLVIREIGRKLQKTKDLTKEYQQLQNTRNALRSSLGTVTPQNDNIPHNEEGIIAAIDSIKKEIHYLEERLFEESEKAEITSTIDSAMKELGYELIGLKPSSTRSSTIHLFHFLGDSGLQVTQRTDGVIRIQVVGLADKQHSVTTTDNDYLLTQQESFCSIYNKIVSTFESKGISAKPETLKKNPPNKQFNKFVDPTEYDPSYSIPSREVFTANQKNMHHKHRMNPPKVISKT